MALAESDRLNEFRTRPGAENLRALLEECRDRVFNVCIQVLRDAHHAEDAAQEALLKIAQGVTKGAEDPRHFTPWMYRVAWFSVWRVAK